MSGTVGEKAEPRRLVVCGMTVMSARSWSPNAPLTTRAGRVFPAMPKSISQTSPRRGVAILFLKGLEQGGGGQRRFPRLPRVRNRKAGNGAAPHA